MQLIIYGNPTTSTSHILDNGELDGTSARVRNKSDSYKERCFITVRGKYALSHKVMDTQTRNYLAEQFTNELKKVKTSAQYHETLHVYAHGSTFGLGFKKKKTENCLYLSPEDLEELLLPYLKAYKDCEKVKLHVCFSGMSYSGTVMPYAEVVAEELKNHSGQLSQSSLEIEGVNGLSVLDASNQTHHALYPSEEIEDEFVKIKNQHQYIVDKGLEKKWGKPKWKVL